MPQPRQRLWSEKCWEALAKGTVGQLQGLLSALSSMTLFFPVMETKAVLIK